MITKQNRPRGGHLLIAVASLLGTALIGMTSASACDCNGKSGAGAMGMSSDHRAVSSRNFAPEIERTRAFLGSDIRSLNGEVLGKVHDIVLTGNHERIAYVVLAYGQFLGFGGKHVAIPWSAFKLVDPTVEGQGRLLLDASLDQVKQAPGFDRTHWPDAVSSDWSAPASHAAAGFSDKSYALSGYDLAGIGYISGNNAIADQQTYTSGEFPKPSAYTSPALEEATRQAAAWRDEISLRRIAMLVDRSVTLDHNPIGRIEDVICDPRNGAVSFAVLSFGNEISELSGRWAVTPWNVLQFESREKYVALRADRSQLIASAFSPDRFPDLRLRVVALGVYDRFNSEPYWQTYGFVGETPTPAAANGMKHGCKLDVKDIVSVSGVVEKVMTMKGRAVEGKPTRPDKVMAVVKTDDGKSLHVFLGSKEYLDSKSLAVAVGDNLILKGWKCEHKEKVKMVVSEIQKGGMTVPLRDDHGKPLWMHVK